MSSDAAHFWQNCPIYFITARISSSLSPAPHAGISSETPTAAPPSLIALNLVSSEIWAVQLPYWFLILTCATLAVILWYKKRWQFNLHSRFIGWLRNLFIGWRFSLRSFFVVTVFLAFVLGMIVCVDRWWIGK